VSTRRSVIKSIAAVGLGAATADLWAAARAAGIVAEPGLPPGAISSAEWLELPGKLPLIKRTFRPPNLETPLEYFREPITPNRAFFVRYHHALIPEVDALSWRLQIGGPGARQPLALSLEQLRQQFEIIEIAALCLCSGNRRGLYNPHVPGLQWGSGAMGTARWRGVRLKDVLASAGLAAESVEVAFEGADGGVLPAAPDYQKSLPIAKAVDANTLIAFEMNGEPLPHWHGAPARLVVPGWTATYWLKHLTAIEVRTTPFDNFWMKTGYRIPLGKFAQLERFTSQDTSTNTPITEIAINSLITGPAPQSRVRRGGSIELSGLAWDGGYGLAAVESSTDAGASWRTARLGTDLGRFAPRPWMVAVQAPAVAGPFTVWVRATSRSGLTQPAEAVPNPAGYHHNPIQTLTLVAS
jgi:DMSO/TMAO reductase YedYZ molybdopterin-dependent catalytic subunit